MKFFVLATIFATTVLAVPAENTKAVSAGTNDQSSALNYLLENSPSGHQAEEDGPAPEGCYWDGTAPFCAGSCPNGYTESGRGSCGDGACCWTGYKFLCCK